MQLREKELMENFDEQNIAQIRSIIAKEKEEGPRIEKAYTMVQVNTSCDVKVTAASRKICVDALLR